VVGVGETDVCESGLDSLLEPCACQGFEFKVGDEVIDADGERCRIRSIDPEDADVPYELEYSGGKSYWVAESGLSQVGD
jgi:hypothetical protein